MKNASLAAVLSLVLLAPAASMAQAAPAPTPAPASASPSAATPGSSDQPAAAPAAAAPPAATNPWAGTSAYTTFAMPTSAIFQGQNQSPDVSVNYFVRVAPRYTINKEWQVRGNIGGSADVVEGINTGTTYGHEFVLNDPAFQLFYTGIPKLPGGVRMLAGVSLRLPLSKAAWAQTLLFSPGVATQFSKGFESMGGDTLLVASLGYQRPIYMSRTPTSQLPYPRATFVGPQTFGTSDDQFTGAVNVRDTFTLVAFAVQSWGKWQPGLFMFVNGQLPYGIKDLGLRQDNVNTWRARTSTYFGAFVDYEINDWFIPEVGYQMFRSVLDADGTYGNPLWGRNQEMQVYLGANIQLDVLYKVLKGDSAEGGVVRASRAPIALSF